MKIFKVLFFALIYTPVTIYSDNQNFNQTSSLTSIQLDSYEREKEGKMTLWLPHMHIKCMFYYDSNKNNS